MLISYSKDCNLKHRQAALPNYRANIFVTADTDCQSPCTGMTGNIHIAGVHFGFSARWCEKLPMQLKQHSALQFFILIELVTPMRIELMFTA